MYNVRILLGILLSEHTDPYTPANSACTVRSDFYMQSGEI